MKLHMIERFIKMKSALKEASIRGDNMGAYISNEWPTSEMWKLAVKKRQELVFSPQYIEEMYDECIMAVTFGYFIPLLEKVLLFSLPSEHEDVLSLFSDKVYIMINNGNLVISNFCHIH